MSTRNTSWRGFSFENLKRRNMFTLETPLFGPPIMQFPGPGGQTVEARIAWQANIKDATHYLIQYSNDGNSWTQLGGFHEFSPIYDPLGAGQTVRPFCPIEPDNARQAIVSPAVTVRVTSLDGGDVAVHGVEATSAASLES